MGDRESRSPWLSGKGLCNRFVMSAGEQCGERSGGAIRKLQAEAWLLDPLSMVLMHSPEAAPEAAQLLADWLC